MAGIYIHIPFCKQACFYCDFHFSTSQERKKDLVLAMISEIQSRKRYLKNESIQTIYFGGGTPSLLSEKELNSILHAISQNFEVDENIEICLEANPDDLDREKLKSLKNTGIGRLSIGVQSFEEELLQSMNRSHSTNQAVNSINWALEAGFDLTVDLIYGIPTQSDASLLSDLDFLIKSGIPHISTYALTVEEKTALFYQVKKAQISIDEEQQIRQYYLILDKLEKSGFEAYELSNYALAGKRSKHNSSYWSGSAYLGIGPSAHSFQGEKRSWNVSNNALYIKSWNEKSPLFEEEILSTKDQYNEWILTRIRLIEGISFKDVEQKFGLDMKRHLDQLSENEIKEGYLILEDDCLKLSRKGRFFADRVASNLFLV